MEKRAARQKLSSYFARRDEIHHPDNRRSTGSQDFQPVTLCGKMRLR